MVTTECVIEKGKPRNLELIAERMVDLYNAVEGYDNPEFRPKDKAFFREEYASLDIERNLVLAWGPQRRLAGMGRIYQIGTAAIGVSVNVRPSSRGEGIGSRLFEQVLKEARSREYKKIRTMIPSYRPYALNLAKEQGFKRVETRIRMCTTIVDDSLTHEEDTELHISEIQLQDDIESWKELQDSLFRDSPLYEPMSADSLSTFRQKPGFIGLLAYKKNEPIGYCTGWETNPSDFFVFGIGVAEEFHHQGYGTILLGTALRKATKRGMSKSSLSVEADNQQAIQFYKKKFNYCEKYRHIHFEVDVK